MDRFLAAALAALATWPLAKAIARPSALAFAAPFAVALLVFAFAGTLEPRSPIEPTDRPIERASDGYVGSAACAKCHPGEHASWHSSFHRTMTQPATRATLLARFERVELDFFGEPVRLQWRGERLWVELRPQRGAARIEREVVQLTGSHHAQVLWYATGNQRELGIVPMVWRVAEERWLPFPAVFLLPPEVREAPLPGTWNGNCNGCHATHSMPRLDTGRVDTAATEFGIACEACHGPGEAHVRANVDPLRRYGLHLGTGRDPTIAEPTRMPSSRSSEVCGQCHSVSIVRQQHFDAWREQGSPFRPGQVLDDSQLVVSRDAARAPELRRKLEQDPKFFEHTFWNDGLPRVTGREFHGLVASPCHANAAPGDARAMTCASCHDLHQDEGDARDARSWARSQLKPGADGDAACTQCHPQYREPAARAAHTHHAPDSVGSACLDCHMPRTSYGLLTTMRSHFVESPSVASELRTGRPNACNLCHLDRSLQWTQDAMAKWYGTPAAALDEEQRTIAAGPRWLLTGDAGLRALAASSAGRAESQKASGSQWLQPYLVQLLRDPYYAVRIVARRSLRTLPAAPDLGDYDELHDDARTAATVERLQRTFATAPANRPEILLDERGVQWDTFRRLLARRDDRPVFLAE